jgi:hypothetical protein
MRTRWALAACAILWAGPVLALPALAEPIEIGQIAQGAIYYNRPAATVAQHDLELTACIRDTLSPGPGDAGNMGEGQGAFGPLMAHLIWDGPIAGLQSAKVENCMLVRGWRAVRLPEPEGAEVAALEGPQLAARLAPWIGAASPHGEIVRTFGNEASHPTGYKTASRAAHADKNQLSLRLNADTNPDRAPLVRFTIGKPAKLDPQWTAKSLKPAEIGTAPPGSALIVARVTGISNRWGVSVVLTREGAAPEDEPSRQDHAPDILVVGTGYLFAKKEGNWFIFAAPPGRWRIASSGVVNYCLGGPSFEAKAGDVIYAGTFHLEGDDLGPDLALEPAKAYLAGPAADRLKPAEYRNGSRGTCHGVNLVYALEIPGAPFAPDYFWGNALKEH